MELTKRELFALVSMLGQKMNVDSKNRSPEEIAEESLMDAECLLEELKDGEYAENEND